MLFSRQKKLQRDRDAGLVFCWRGGQGGNRGGMLLSVLLASCVFVFAFWGVSLDFKVSKPESRIYAKVLLLDDFSSEMALWVDQNSPFPSRWDPLMDQAHQVRVDHALSKVFQQMTTPPSPWLDMPEASLPLSKPRLIQSGEVELGSLPESQSHKPNKGVLELVVALEALGDLGRRQPVKISPMNVLIPKQAYGGTLRFVVSVNAQGDVVFIAPADWREGEYERDIESWLRLQKFKPAQTNSLEVGEVSIKVEVKNHVGN